jgi:mRNA interferase RelE/StbE
LAWRIEIDAAAEKDLAKLDKHIAWRIIKFLQDRVATLDNPHSIGETLKGIRFGEFWKYRVGDYRVISKIEDEVLLILVVRIGHRRRVYRRR